MSHPKITKPSFDRIARPYRYLEYLTLGPLLQQTRTHHLPSLTPKKQALVLGDGDGRFTQALLNINPHIQIHAVDTSATMLQLLRQRCNNSPLLTTHHQDALTHTPHPATDLITAHFFFDCLSQTDLNTLIQNLARQTRPDTLWLVSDFRIPTGPLRPFARLYIRALYLAFRLLTNLRTTQLPNYASPLTAAGLARLSQHQSLFGLLTTELWQRTTPTTVPT